MTSLYSLHNAPHTLRPYPSDPFEHQQQQAALAAATAGGLYMHTQQADSSAYDYSATTGASGEAAHAQVELGAMLHNWHTRGQLLRDSSLGFAGMGMSGMGMHMGGMGMGMSAGMGRAPLHRDHSHGYSAMGAGQLLRDSSLGFPALTSGPSLGFPSLTSGASMGFTQMDAQAAAGTSAAVGTSLSAPMQEAGASTSAVETAVAEEGLSFPSLNRGSSNIQAALEELQQESAAHALSTVADASPRSEAGSDSGNNSQPEEPESEGATPVAGTPLARQEYDGSKYAPPTAAATTTTESEVPVKSESEQAKAQALADDRDGAASQHSGSGSSSAGSSAGSSPNLAPPSWSGTSVSTGVTSVTSSPHMSQRDLGPPAIQGGQSAWMQSLTFNVAPGAGAAGSNLLPPQSSGVPLMMPRTHSTPSSSELSPNSAQRELLLRPSRSQAQAQAHADAQAQVSPPAHIVIQQQAQLLQQQAHQLQVQQQQLQSLQNALPDAASSALPPSANPAFGRSFSLPQAGSSVAYHHSDHCQVCVGEGSCDDMLLAHSSAPSFVNHGSGFPSSSAAGGATVASDRYTSASVVSSGRATPTLQSLRGPCGTAPVVRRGSNSINDLHHLLMLHQQNGGTGVAGMLPGGGGGGGGGVAPLPSPTGSSPPGSSSSGLVGIYSKEERARRVARFMDKRQRRCWSKRVLYQVRQDFAVSRVRVGGRFIKKQPEAAATAAGRAAVDEQIQHASMPAQH